MLALESVSDYSAHLAKLSGRRLDRTKCLEGQGSALSMSDVRIQAHRDLRRYDRVLYEVDIWVCLCRHGRRGWNQEDNGRWSSSISKGVT